jgi:superfamily II DNA or RNA helicase
MSIAAKYEVGAIVQTRGREWVVVPGDDDSILHLRPLGGNDDDVIGVLPAIELVRPATFPLPDPEDFGDHVSARLLRDAVRLNIRAGAGPFRSFGRIAVEPRPYQLVPLLMALKLDPVRLMIADDVGIGKTIEAGLIARELLDRGEIRRIGVICPAHLCDQWQAELKSKFEIDAEVIRPGTIRRLQRGLTADQSVFEVHPFVIVSIDYIKNQTRRDEFLRAAPEFLIVDEAHTCSAGGQQNGAQQQRHRLLQDLVNNPSAASKERHLVLATATPHSGDDSAFRSLLSLLDPAFSDLPADDEMSADHPLRQRLSNHLVQRRRPDIEDYLDEETPFPKRAGRELTWKMDRASAAFFESVLDYARDEVDRVRDLRLHQQRVSWWAALALMRATVSSPAAAIAALRTKASGITVANGEVTISDSIEAIDDQGQRAVLDPDIADIADLDDLVPGADSSDVSGGRRNRRTLAELIKQAETIQGKADPKLQRATAEIDRLLSEGFRPIIFCRYIATANYVADYLTDRFKGVRVEAVTGTLPPEERKQRVEDLAQYEQRVLVATDCLSEGINLQEHFDAVLHYDLAWNPTRHEQRAGRVDRFGQERSSVEIVMLYGGDNPVDIAVMDVLIRKAEQIRSRLGVSVAVPQRSGAIMDSVFEAIFHGRGTARQLELGQEFDEALKAQEAALTREWDAVEKRSRTIFSQRSIHPELVKTELAEVRGALGSTDTVQRFVTDICSRLNTNLAAKNDRFLLPLNGMPARVNALFPNREVTKPIPVSFTFPVPDGVEHLARTSEVVEAMASIALDGALDQAIEPRPARSSSAILTDAITTQTTLAVARIRVHLNTATRTGSRAILSEESLLLGWRWSDEGSLEVLTDVEVDQLLQAAPSGNLTNAHRIRVIQRALEDEQQWRPLLDAHAKKRAVALLESHRRVRDVAGITGAGRLSAEAMTPVDLLGLFIYLPA